MFITLNSPLESLPNATNLPQLPAMTLSIFDPDKRQRFRDWADTSRSNLSLPRDRSRNSSHGSSDSGSNDPETAPPSSMFYQDTALGGQMPRCASPSPMSSELSLASEGATGSSGAGSLSPPPRLTKKRSDSGLITKVIYHATGISTIVEIEKLVLKCTIPGADVRGPTSLLLDKIITSLDSDAGDGKESALGMLMCHCIWSLTNLLFKPRHVPR